MSGAPVSVVRVGLLLGLCLFFMQAFGAEMPSAMPPATAIVATPDPIQGLDGRLFFSPQERQRMDATRKRGGLSELDLQGADIPPSVLNGFVKRSDGNTAVWVDGNLRWNAQSGRVRGLQPTDVGGSAAYVQASSTEASAAAPLPRARARNVVKPRAKKITKPRIATRR